MNYRITENNERIFSIGEEEWFDRLSFKQKAEEIIAYKLAETFTDEELKKLVKIDIKKVEKLVVEKIAEKVVDECLKSKAFRGQE